MVVVAVASWLLRRAVVVVAEAVVVGFSSVSISDRGLNINAGTEEERRPVEEAAAAADDEEENSAALLLVPNNISSVLACQKLGLASV